MGEIKNHPMRATITTILLFLTIGFFANVQAQVTAVMQARVNVISGAGLSEVQESIIDLGAETFSLSEEVSAGSFSLTASPGTDLTVNVVNSSDINSAKGETIEFESFSVDHQSTPTGKHNISIDGKIKNQLLEKGHYTGAVSVVVDYL